MHSPPFIPVPNPPFPIHTASPVICTLRKSGAKAALFWNGPISQSEAVLNLILGQKQLHCWKLRQNIATGVAEVCKMKRLQGWTLWVPLFPQCITPLIQSEWNQCVSGE